MSLILLQATSEQAPSASTSLVAIGEYVGIVSGDGDTDYQSLIGTGLTYALSEDVVLDIGANFGITEEAEDVNVFAGVTMRF